MICIYSTNRKKFLEESKHRNFLGSYPCVYPLQVWNNLFLNQARLGANGLTMVANIRYFIWKARNAIVFDHIPPDPDKLILATSNLLLDVSLNIGIKAQNMHCMFHLFL